jgi:hypothetical protein
MPANAKHVLTCGRTPFLRHKSGLCEHSAGGQPAFVAIAAVEDHHKKRPRQLVQLSAGNRFAISFAILGKDDISIIYLHTNLFIFLI